MVPSKLFLNFTKTILEMMFYHKRTNVVVERIGYHMLVLTVIRTKEFTETHIDDLGVKRFYHKSFFHILSMKMADARYVIERTGF